MLAEIKPNRKIRNLYENGKWPNRKGLFRTVSLALSLGEGRFEINQECNRPIIGAGEGPHLFTVAPFRLGIFLTQ